MSSSSGSLGPSIFTSNLEAEKEPCPRIVNSAMKADIVRAKKKPGIMALYPEGNAIFQNTLQPSIEAVILLKQLS